MRYTYTVVRFEGKRVVRVYTSQYLASARSVLVRVNDAFPKGRAFIQYNKPLIGGLSGVVVGGAR
jgi:hypothetical protein